MKPRDQKQQTKDDRGIRCPACGCGHWRVIYTRASWGGRLMRRRECRHCGHRVTSVECLGSPKICTKAGRFRCVTGSRRG